MSAVPHSDNPVSIDQSFDSITVYYKEIETSGHGNPVTLFPIIVKRKGIKRKYELAFICFANLRHINSSISCNMPSF